MMPSLPPEITALIVEDIVRSQKTTSISSLIFAWPDNNILPFIRKYRFRKVRISSPARQESFIAISSPEVMAAVRKISFGCGCPHPLDTARVIQLISTAVKMEEIVLWNFAIGLTKDIFVALGACTHLTTIYLSSVTADHLSDVFRALQFLPHLTTLKLQHLRIRELTDIASGLDTAVPFDVPVPWDTQNFPAPPAVPQVSCLDIEYDGTSDMMFLDLISGPKTPFSDLKSIAISSHNAGCYRFCRISAILRRYSASLRVLEIGNGVVSQSALSHPISIGRVNSPHPLVSSFVLPPSLESFKFYAGQYLDPLCRTLYSGKGILKTVTVCPSYFNYPDFMPALDRLDDVLAGLGLEELDIEGNTHIASDIGVLVEAHFPRCLGRYASEGVVGGTYILRGM